MCEDIYKPKNLDRQTSLEWAGIWGIFGDESRLNLPPRGGRSEMGRGRGKHLLFLDTVYGTRDLILASSCRWLRTRRKMKGRHMGGTTVVVGV
jgi:hypothetical protein